MKYTVNVNKYQREVSWKYVKYRTTAPSMYNLPKLQFTHAPEKEQGFKSTQFCTLLKPGETTLSRAHKMRRDSTPPVNTYQIGRRYHPRSEIMKNYRHQEAAYDSEHKAGKEPCLHSEHSVQHADGQPS